MQKMEIFDPPMCCSTGICGPSVDPKLVRFAADLDWLKSKGVTVERCNLAQQPGAFAANPEVMTALTLAGNACLPLIVVDGTVASKGLYPNRQALAAFAGIILSEKDLASEPPWEIPSMKNNTCSTSGSNDS